MKVPLMKIQFIHTQGTDMSSSRQKRKGGGQKEATYQYVIKISHTSPNFNCADEAMERG